LGGDAQVRGRFAPGSTAEGSQAHEFRPYQLDRGRSVKGVANREEVVIGVASEKTVQIDHHLPPCPSLGGHRGAGVIDEDPAHGFGGGREEVTAAVEQLVSDQARLSFVNQGDGAEGLPGGFGRHACGGELPPFVVDERKKVGGGLVVATVRGFEQAGHIAHHGRVCQLKAAEPQEHEGDLAIPPPRRVRQLYDVSILTTRSIASPSRSLDA
jgi:hypothetical protein